MDTLVGAPENVGQLAGGQPVPQLFCVPVPLKVERFEQVKKEPGAQSATGTGTQVPVPNDGGLGAEVKLL